MAISLLTNVPSLTAQRSLTKSSNALNTTFQRLSSGLRINRAADDAAGLGIGARFTAEIRGMNQAVRNTNDTISLLQLSDAAMSESVNSLQRMRELAVQAASGTLTTTDRTNLNAEYLQLSSEVDRIANNTKFNNQLLLTGSFAAKMIQVGQYSGQFLSVTINRVVTSTLGISAGTTLSGTSGDEAWAAITAIDVAIQSLSSVRATVGALQNRFDSVISNLGSSVENTEAARSRIMDADIAVETSALTRNTILQQAAVSVLAQANQQPQIALSLLGGR